MSELTAEEDRQEVTSLELFFDLVIVFAITQVTAFIAHDPNALRLAEGLAILAVLWFVWSGFAWLGNTAASDEGAMRVVLLSVMGPMLVVSLAVPHAFDDDGVIFGLGVLAARLLHIVGYVVISREDPALRGVVSRLATTVLPASLLLVLAGALDGTAQALCWVAALGVDYGGLIVRGVDGWRVKADHFAERHGLVVIIALGESIVSIGVGAAGLELGAGVVAASLLGVAAAGAMWWAYFDMVAIAGERALSSAGPIAQARMARDSYTYLHLPMVGGIVLFALGVKKTLAHLSDPLDDVAAIGLCGGVALFFLAMSAFKRRNYGSWNGPRLICAAALVAIGVLATQIAALAALALVALAAVALVSYEALAWAAARDRIRHAQA